MSKEIQPRGNMIVQKVMHARGGNFVAHREIFIVPADPNRIVPENILESIAQESRKAEKKADKRKQRKTKQRDL
jgi:hypothetical protein